ncbi:MAG: type II CRISPR RNA-guided endonuclease Cas9 [Eubacteriaceae bacterium]|nr:type II CRISPR RNA-guided endonuclease Cas9 [Eubacteriaceae bacterium]
MAKKYTIGLDIGTNSVGWAVIDEKLELVKGKKHINDNGIKKRSRTNLWGADLFDAGETAEERRSKRGMRRRLKRRHERLNYLRGIFESEIMKTDNSFFIRLDESFYQGDDKTAKEFHYRDENGILKTRRIENKEVYKYPLFKTEEEEKTYYERFKTIYHLRDYLMNTDEKADIRWIYLAMHHILKYRGHFVNQGQSFDLKNIDIAENLDETLEAFNNATEFYFNFDGTDREKANDILKNNRLSKSKKAYDLNELYKLDADIMHHGENIDYLEAFEEKTPRQRDKYIESKQKQIKELFTAIVGNKISPDRIFDNKEYNTKTNEEFPKDIYFKNEEFENQINELERFMTPEEIEVLLNGKKVYEAIVLSGILTKETLSASMVEKYDLHKKQLAELKSFTKAVSGEFYDKFFKKEGIYSKYIDGIGNPTKKSTRDDFYKEIKKAFESEFKGLEFPMGDKDFDWNKTELTEEQRVFFDNISKAMVFESYLPKQRMSDNGAIPYQIHEYELVKIIENQGKYYPFLLEKTGEKYKIQTLMTFRIPYYVGPLTQAGIGDEGSKTSDKSQFAWMQKKKDGKITPWNFDEVVDKDASSIEFIERMTSFCTYLPDEKVLPKNSLLYQEFCVYNELIVSGYYEKGRKEYFNMILMDGLVENLFKRKRKVTEEDVIGFLQNEKNIDATELFGIDKRSVNGKPSFNNSMSTFIDLRNMGIDANMIEDNRDLFDEIVKWQTVFTDKKSLKERIKKANDEWKLLTKQQIEKLANKHYKGFGNLSKKLLDGIADESTGLTIIEMIKSGGYDNFMRLVSGETADRYTYKKQIEEMQTKGQTENLTFDAVEKLAGSPAIKKGIWQSLKIIKELEKHLERGNISKIVIEMSREDGGGRTQSRYKQLKKIYEAFEEANKDVLDELKAYEKNEKALDSERLHLYFRQNGRDAYTGKELNIMELSSYEVDHIIPQCYLKDDSLDNKVLVSHISNQQKGGNVPSKEIIRNMKFDFWEPWLKAGLISQKKFKNLTTGRLTEKVKEGFINRQLVENRQITKHVANILVKYFEGTDTVVLTPKSALAAQFRKGILYLPNPAYDEKKAKESPAEYGVKRFLEEKLHGGFPKIRNLNDYHHAHDAYLNAVVASYLYGHYPQLKNAWVYGEYQRNGDDVFGKWVAERKNRSLQLLSDMIEEKWELVDPDTGELIEIDRDQTLAKMEKTLGYKNVNIVKKTERQMGKFGDESVYKKEHEATNFAAGIKRDLDPNKYGGTKAPVSAFAVVIKNNKGEVTTLSIPAMEADDYLKSGDKLTFIRKLYPKQKIEEILVEEVDKYAKFENVIDGKKVVRLMASAGEAQKAASLTLTVDEARALLDAKEDMLIDIYNKISGYLDENAVYNNTHLDNWQSKVREEFESLPTDKKRQFIIDAFSITKTGTTNAKGMVKGKIGKASGQQQHKNRTYDVIRTDTTLIYQSVTGIYEARKTIE